MDGLADLGIDRGKERGQGGEAGAGAAGGEAERNTGQMGAGAGERGRHGPWRVCSSGSALGSQSRK